MNELVADTRMPEIASSMVYRENREADFLGVLQSPLQRSFEDQVELNVAKV